MTQLATELAATNNLIREALHTPPPERPPHRPGDTPVDRFRPAAALLAAHAYFGMNILGDHFRPVPAEKVTREGKDATVSCSCGHATQLSTGQLASCRCGRWYFAGKQHVHWAPAPDPHTCTANTEGWCDECGADL